MRLPPQPDKGSTVSMNAQRVSDLCIVSRATIVEALERLDQTGMGTLFVLDGEGRFCGAVTDGDIRRGLLSGMALRDPVSRATNFEAVSFPIDAPSDAVVATLSDRIRVLPLLDGNRRPVDYASLICSRKIPVLEPDLSGNEVKYVSECLRTGWISSKGRYVTLFEQQFTDLVGTAHAITTSSGTAALHLALVGLGIGSGDEVIVPNLTFAATINAVLLTGATPVLVDIEPAGWTIDTDQVRRAVSDRTRAIIPVHLYGLPADMDALEAIAAPRGIALIEDAAESLGAAHRGRPTGSVGRVGCFSFFGNKMLTTGEGGMVVTNDPGLARRMRLYRDHGMDPTRRYWHLDVGFNYRMTNLQAAVGVAQLERFAVLLDRKRRIAAAYAAMLGGDEELTLQAGFDDRESSHWIVCVLLPSHLTEADRDETIRRLAFQGIETRPVFYPLHRMPPYRRFAEGRSFPVSDRVGALGICLPSSVTLDTGAIDEISQALRSVIRDFGGKPHGDRFRVVVAS